MWVQLSENTKSLEKIMKDSYLAKHPVLIDSEFDFDVPFTFMLYKKNLRDPVFGNVECRNYEESFVYGYIRVYERKNGEKFFATEVPWQRD